MKVDYNEVPKADITFKVEAEEGRSYDIAKAYEDILTSAELFKYVADKCGMDSEISECISLEERLESLESPTDILKVNVYAVSLDKCEEIVKAICEYAESKARELQPTLGNHSLSLVSKSVSTVYSKEIYDNQIANQNTIIGLKRTIAAVVDAFKEEEKAYYELKTNAVIREDEEAVTETEITPEEIVIPKISVDKKKLAIGLVGGLFLYALTICIGYICNGKVKDSDDFERLCGINKLGKIYREKESRLPGKRLDRSISSLKRRGRKKVSIDEAESIVISNILAVADKNNSDKIAIICNSDEESFCSEIVKELSEKIFKAVLIKELTTSSKAINEVSEFDSVVIVAKTNVTKYNEIWD